MYRYLKLLLIIIVCSRRKDNFNNSFHNYFLNYKRIGYTEFLNFIDEGENLRVDLNNLEALKRTRKKVDDWLVRSKLFITSIFILDKCLGLVTILDKLDPKKLKVNFFEDSSEKFLIDLYNESEGFPVETEMGTTIVLMLKQSDWFKEATKCLESKKFSIKIAKKVLCNSSSIFTKEFIINSNQSDVEQEYLSKISSKQTYLYDEILIIYDKFNNIMSKFHEYKLGLKSEFDDIEEIIHQMELNNNCDELLEIIQRYEDWKNIVKLAINDPKNVNPETFNEFKNQANSFPFKTTFLENFKRISLNQNNSKDNALNSKVYLTLFKDDNNLKKKKNEKEYFAEKDFTEDSEKDNNSIIKINLEHNQ